MKDEVGNGTDDAQALALSRERTTETGRGTMVFVKEQGGWRAVTIHLSRFPGSIF